MAASFRFLRWLRALLLASLLLLPGAAGTAQTATAQAPPPEQPEYVTYTDASGTAWLWDPRWAAQIEDTALLDALVLAATVDPAWRYWVGAKLAGKGTRIVWSLPGELDDAEAAYHEGWRNRILVNRLLRTGPGTGLGTGTDGARGVVASLLAHEVYHATYPPDPGIAGCLANEAAAHSWQASVWDKTPERWREHTSRYARFNDRLVTAWYQGRLGPLVAENPAYVSQCRVLVGGG